MTPYVHPKERRYFGIAVAVSGLIYLALAVSIVGILYVCIGFAVYVVAQGIFIGRLRGNGVLVTRRQFPDLFERTATLAQAMGLPFAPDVYVLQAGGALNAFATRFFGRNFVVIYADVLELAYERGEPEVAFVLAHELGHLRLGHMWKKALIYPAQVIPFLGAAYSRACEYSCDGIGADLEPAGASGGILVLAAGKRLYREIDPEAFAEQARTPDDLWVWLAEHLASHPNLPKRLLALRARDRELAVHATRAVSQDLNSSIGSG
jgi:Zn-dependent protease with chaperone function